MPIDNYLNESSWNDLDLIYTPLSEMEICDLGDNPRIRSTWVISAELVEPETGFPGPLTSIQPTKVLSDVID